MNVLLAIVLLGCSEVDPEPEIERPLDAEIVDVLSWTRMRAHVEVLADDARGGRLPGSYGHRISRDYIEAEMKEIGLLPIGLDNTYLYP